MMKITKIEKSWKKEGYAFVALEDGTSKLRKVYDNQTTLNKYSVNLGADVYSFRWNGSIAEDIKWELNYSKKGMVSKINIEDIKGEVKDFQKPITIEINPDATPKHEKYLQIITCIENNIPVYLYGPAGSGKNHILQEIAETLELGFYFTNSVQQEYKITGFIDAGGKYHETEFYKAFKNGGLFFLDEMDASIPEVLILLNAAIANKYFEFPNGKIDAHENFRVVAAGNTAGNGADEQYVGRLQLDSSTLDRFVFIQFDYDKNIELKIAKGNKELVEFVRGLREKAAKLGIKATFSYRSIIMVTSLEGKMQLTDVIQIAIVKGLDKDTINTLKNTTGDSNRYYRALNQVIAK